MGFLASTVDKNAKMAIYWYEKSAQQGNVDAMRDLSFGYSEFLNTYKLGYGPIGHGYDEEKELYWLKKAADAGDAKSLLELKERGK